MLMPGFGEIYVSPAIRLLVAMGISAVMLPIVGATLPPIPGDVLSLFLIILAEITVGLFIGAVTRILQATLHIAGMIIAFQSSLASALLFDANQGSQGSVFGNFLTLVGLTILFTSDLHHFILIGISDSYNLFSPTDFPPINDFAKFAAMAVSSGFLVAFKISAPLIVVGLLLYLGAGMMARLMPNMQVFFILIPLQIYVAFFLLMIILSSGMMWYLSYFEEMLQKIFGI